ncbi:SatD family protein [Croceiramulus getboli]|nr:SatD family protein [Flavobacteriaceae bacterium YJPT1-3]
MKYLVISGDLVASSSLTATEKSEVEQQLKHLLQTLNTHFKVYGRIIKGDYLECVVPEIDQGMRVALFIKSFVKSIPLSTTKEDARIKTFRTHGIRLAMGFGTLERYQPEAGIIDGDAIYRSGRAIQEESTHDKERIIIKNTLFFDSAKEDLNRTINTLLLLLDTLLAKSTKRQSEVVCHKLLGKSEEEIAQLLGISQSSINQHSTAVGWNAIDRAVSYFSYRFKNLP